MVRVCFVARVSEGRGRERKRSEANCLSLDSLSPLLARSPPHHHHRLALSPISPSFLGRFALPMPPGQRIRSYLSSKMLIGVFRGAAEGAFERGKMGGRSERASPMAPLRKKNRKGKNFSKFSTHHRVARRPRSPALKRPRGLPRGLSGRSRIRGYRVRPHGAGTGGLVP